MDDSDSPVLRLIPYLAAITVTVFLGLRLWASDLDRLLVLLIALVAYFGTYVGLRALIGFLLRRRHGHRS